MATPPVGSVVLVPFPFSDLSAAKLRPAVLLANVGRGDHILCQITSNRYGDPAAIELRDDDFSSGGLQRVSYVRPGKIFTANDSLIVRAIGTLTPGVMLRIVGAISGILEPGRRFPDRA